jgi:hypothetical protein
MIFFCGAEETQRYRGKIRGSFLSFSFACLCLFFAVNTPRLFAGYIPKTTPYFADFIPKTTPYFADSVA